MNNEQKKTKRRFTDSRGFWIIVSLLMATLLWLYVTTTEGVEVETDITGVPIEFVGTDALRESSGLVITEQDQTSVDLRVKATRRVLRQLNSSNVTATVNLNRVTTDGRYTVSLDISYPSGVSEEDVTLVHSSVNTVNFYVDRMIRRTIPMEGEFTGNTADGYLVDSDPVFDPLVVAISGPKSAVDQVDHAYISISRTEVDKTLQFSSTYELRNANDEVVDDASITRETEEVNVTLNVLSTKQVPLDVTIINGGGATRDENTKIDIEPKSIMLSGDASAIDGTTKINLGTIDLGTFATEYSNTYTIVPPNDTENITGVTEATVTVSIVGLATKNLEIIHDNISCTNVPEGYTAEIVNQALSVTIRAPQEVLDAIQVNNLYAVADLTDISDTNASGVIMPTARISINGFPEAGVIGEYKIYVTLMKE